MQTVELNIGDDVNISDFFRQLKDMYPSLQIVKPQTLVNSEGKFTGIDDLKPLYVPNFKMHSREELYDDR